MNVCIEFFSSKNTLFSEKGVVYYKGAMSAAKYQHLQFACEITKLFLWKSNDKLIS